MRYDDEITPASVVVAFARWWWIGAGALALIAALTLAAWQAGWWFQNQDTARQNQLYQNGYATQQSDIETMQSSIAAIPSAADRAQQRADVNEACQYAALITSMPATYTAWVAANCQAGAMSPSSQYAN